MDEDDEESDISLFGLAIGALLWFFAINFFVQLALKPTEVFRFAGVGEAKTPRGTWLHYGDDFRRHATPIMTADFLAGMAQLESSGNPYAQPPWVWRWTATPWRLFAPASSAVGLMQMIDGNFSLARRHCIQSGKPATDSCRLNGFYSRLSASDSIEMTSAFLHRQVERVAPKKATLRQRQQLAAVMHLCGPEKGPLFVRSGFSAGAMGVCGRQAVDPYVRRVMRYREEFAVISARAP